MASSFTLRPAQRADIPTLARIANNGNALSAIHRRIAPYRDQYPIDYYQWRLNMIRERFAQPDLRTIVAEDFTTGEILGSAAWVVEGSDTALYKRWISEGTWADWLESKFVWIERRWGRYTADKSIDYQFLRRFMAAIIGHEKAARPACLHCHLIVVNPKTQAKGVGRMLMDWAKDLAMQEDLPIYLESNLEATGFYDTLGFSKLSKDIVLDLTGEEPFRVPAYVWEGKQREGTWLIRDEDSDGGEGMSRWKDNVLPK